MTRHHGRDRRHSGARRECAGRQFAAHLGRDIGRGDRPASRAGDEDERKQDREDFHSLYQRPRIRFRRKTPGTPAEFENAAKALARGALHWTSYGSGTFVRAPHAKRGKRNRDQVVGDPGSWWRSAGDVSSRASWLRAYAAERLPELFEVVTVRKSPCIRCGGRGVVKKGSLHSLKAVGGRHEWFENCPRCYGAQNDRGIGFR